MVGVDASEPVLEPEHLTEASTLAGAEPDRRLVLLRHDADQGDDVLGRGHPFGSAGEPAKDGRDSDGLAWVVRDDLVDNGGIHDRVEHVEVRTSGPTTGRRGLCSSMACHSRMSVTVIARIGRSPKCG